MCLDPSHSALETGLASGKSVPGLWTRWAGVFPPMDVGQLDGCFEGLEDNLCRGEVYQWGQSWKRRRGLWIRRGHHTCEVLPIQTYRPRELLTFPGDLMGSQALTRGMYLAEFT